MGGTKMFQEITFGDRRPRKSLWSPMIEKPEEKEDSKCVSLRMPRESFHQTSPITYPQHFSEWRKYIPQSYCIQPRIVEKPDLARLQKQCKYRKKLERAKAKATKTRSDFSLLKFVKSEKLRPREIYLWEKTLKPERLEVLLKYLASSVESQQIYAAQALGQLRFAEESVISALHYTVKECNSLPLQYEAARSLALLGCLDAPVVKVLIRYLKMENLNRREDTLVALKISLKTWSQMPPFERYCIAGQSYLIRNIEPLVNLEDPTDKLNLDAALCLGYLDRTSPLAQTMMFMCLAQKDWRKKNQALVMLVSHMGIMDAAIIQEVLDQLQQSPIYKHRVTCARLLTTIGLERIQEESIEDNVFNVLLWKISEEPSLVPSTLQHRLMAVGLNTDHTTLTVSVIVVRQSIALAIEELKMKKQVLEIAERKLKDEVAEVRKQGVIALGVLGLHRKNMFFALLEMLELDTSEAVRVQVIRAFSTLGMNNQYVRKSLRNKEHTQGIIARECTKALKILDKLSEAQRESILQPYKID